jgi:two-component system response regulator RpfG
VAADLDPETGCVTSASLADLLEGALERASGTSSHTALLLLRLLAPADEAVSARAFGERLAAIGAAEGIGVARLGPSEFAVLSERSALRDARMLAARLRLLAQHGLGDGRGAALCVGLAVAPTHGESPRRLLEAARDALGQAIAEGLNREVVAQPAAASSGDGTQGTTQSERLAMLRTLARVVDERHRQGEARAAAVARRARSLAVALELSSADVDVVTLAAELHDIGRMLLPGVAGADAGGADRRRAALAGHLVASSGLPQVGAAMARVYEAWDGSGALGERARDFVPRASRIVAVALRFEHALERAANAPDAVRSALEEVLHARGAALDPGVVDALAATLAAEAGAASLADAV